MIEVSMEKPNYLTKLIVHGLQLLSDVAALKGSTWVLEETGIDITKESLTPDELIVLKQYEMEHEEELLRPFLRDIPKLEIRESDKEDLNAVRDMQGAMLQQPDILAKRFIYYLAGFWSVFVSIYIVMITFLPIPTVNIRFADTILGFLLGALIATIVNYFYGTSASSARNGDTIRGVLKNVISK